MAHTLYHGEPNGPSLTLLAALFEKDVEAELVAIDLASGGRHALDLGVEAQMSVEGEGAVLVADGEAMVDSVFVGQYLDDVGTGPRLFPDDALGQWRVQTFCRYIIERVAPAAAYLGVQSHLAPKLAAMDDAAFDTAMGRIASVDLADRWRAARAGEFAEEKLADSRAKIAQAVERLEQQLEGDWLLGDFSLADLEAYSWLAGIVEIVPDAFAAAPKVKAWLDRVAARPSVARALGLSKSGAPQQAWAPGPEINRWG